MRDADEQIQIRQGYDHNFCLRGGVSDAPRFAARVEDPGSGRVLELWTNQPGVQFYSGNFLDGTVTGKYGRAPPPVRRALPGAAGLSEYAEPSGFSVGAARSRTNLSPHLALSIFRELRQDRGVRVEEVGTKILERSALPSR